MGYLRKASILSYPLVVFFIVSIYINNACALHGVFNLKMKSQNRSMLKRQTPHRMLTDGSPDPIDFHLRGNSSTWVYSTEVSIGTPAQNFVLLVDTGSQVTWINCQNCDGCQMDDNERGIHLKSYNPGASTTSEIARPGETFSTTFIDTHMVSGHYVKDYITYNKVTGDQRTEPAKAKFIFGCTTKEVLISSQLIDNGISGLLGLGITRNTMLDQMNSTGDARNVFSICVDTKRGGGIFAVGRLVKPVVPMMKYIEIANSYALVIRSLMLGDVKIEVNATARVVLDTGTPAGLVPASMHNALSELITNRFHVEPEIIDDFNCFRFPGMDVSEEFFDQVLPPLTFSFSDTMSFTVFPRHYLAEFNSTTGLWCVQTQKVDFGGLYYVLGTPFLSGKLIAYDNDNKSVGFMDYDCSSTIEVEGDDIDQGFEVGSHIV